jgi:hypothetical protein
MATRMNLGFGKYLTKLGLGQLSLDDSSFDNRCIMCREELTKDTKTDEHIFPKWLLKRYNLWNVKMRLPNQSQTPYRQFTVPCCKECNGGIMSEWENMVKDASEKGFDEFIKLPEEVVVWWLMKIYYAKLVKEQSFRENVKDPNSSVMISDDQLFLYRNIYTYMYELLKGTKFGKHKPYELYIFRTYSDKEFDYLDDIYRHVVYMRLNDILIICALDSFDFFSIQYKKELEELNKMPCVDPIQALELFAKILYYKTHYKFESVHELIVSENGVRLDSELKNIEQIRSFNTLELHQLLCNIFNMRGFYVENQPFVEGKMISTIFKA